MPDPAPATTTVSSNRPGSSARRTAPDAALESASPIPLKDDQAHDSAAVAPATQSQGRKSLSGRQRTPERGRPRLSSAGSAPGSAAANLVFPASLASLVGDASSASSPRIRSRSRQHGDDDGASGTSNSWRMMSIAHLLRRDGDAGNTSDVDLAGIGPGRPPSPTSSGAPNNASRNWLGSFLSRANAATDMKMDVTSEAPSEGMSPLLSRRSSSRQRRNSGYTDEGEVEASISSMRLPWLSRKSGGDEKRSVHDGDSTSEKRKSISSHKEKRKSIGGSDTEGEGDRSINEKKKPWKLFTRSNGNASEDLSLESQGRDKSRSRGAWFFSGRSSPPPMDSDSSSKGRPKSDLKAAAPPAGVAAEEHRQPAQSPPTPSSTPSSTNRAASSTGIPPTPSTLAQDQTRSVAATLSNLSLNSSGATLQGRKLSSLSSGDPKIPKGPDTGYQSGESREGTPSQSSYRESSPAIVDPSRNSLNRPLTKQLGVQHTPSPDALSRLPMSFRGLPLASQLILAAEHGYVEAIRTLLDLGVSPSCRDENATLLTPLIQAARHGHSEAVELLVERGARLEDRDPDIGGTAVFHAAINGWHETVRVLVKLGGDPNAPEWTGCTPIFAASFHGHNEVVEALIELGGSVDSAGPSGTPIHAAIEGRQLGILKMLLNRSKNVDNVDAVGRTPLWIASQAGLLPVVDLLLDHGAVIDKTSDEGTRPLWAAIVNDHPDIACRLVERGADVMAPLPSGALGN
ncbi:hypothetical protein HK405_012358, partial [Cladochytrium tenue]